MRFDDRLSTVLAQPASSSHGIAVRWRQLVELVARAPSDGDRDMIGQAISEIRDNVESVDERVRVAAALAVASLPLPAGMVAIFAADRLAVAAPILASARLTASEWKAVAAAASDECRAFIATMRVEQPQASPHQAPARERDDHPHIPSISEVVARIERLRQPRDDDRESAAELPQSSAESRLFRWECNAVGEIDWVEGAPRGALVGQSIAQPGSAGGVSRTVERAFASRAPFHDALIDLPGEASVSGRWKISGIPAFERSTGRFAGYRGIAERSDGQPGADCAPEADSLREMAHEIRTPLNAIIGFAEIISGEYLGPAESRYRERAGEIVEQAHLLLTAIEDLDFAARVKSGAGPDRPRFALGELVESMGRALAEVAAPKDVGIDLSQPEGEIMAAFSHELAQRLILRMCSAVIEKADNGERLRVSVRREGDSGIVSISRPAAFQNRAEPEDFRIRLARGLAKAAGISLVDDDGALSLIFPRG